MTDPLDIGQQSVDWLASLDIDALLTQAETEARAIADGHLSLLRFTTCWKACYGTVSFDLGAEYQVVFHWLPAHPTIKGALVDLLLHRWHMKSHTLTDAQGRRYSAQFTAPGDDIRLTVEHRKDGPMSDFHPGDRR